MRPSPVIYDITLPISEHIAVWPGDPAVTIRLSSSVEQGDEATTSIFTLGSHTGTHIDAPGHFFPGGDSVEKADLNIMIGEAWVIEVPDTACLTADVLESLQIPPAYERVLFHTRNSRRWQTDLSTFNRDYVSLSEDGAEWLVARGTRLVGIDSLSIAPFENGLATHRVLLSNGVMILEGINLSGIRTGAYELVCLPLKIACADGAPARVVLIDRTGQNERR